MANTSKVCGEATEFLPLVSDQDGVGSMADTDKADLMELSWSASAVSTLLDCSTDGLCLFGWLAVPELLLHEPI